jgi:hypothetical protein
LTANPNDKAVAELEADWPSWQVWTVPRVVGGALWCARRWDGTGETLKARSADELVGHLEEAATQ